MDERYTCEKCGRTMAASKFFQYKDGRKTELCKNCLTMHIDNFDESTYLWALKKMDVAYIPAFWEKIRSDAFAKNPNLTGMSVFGKYLSKMKLKQYKQYGFDDSEKAMIELGQSSKITAEERKAYDEEIKEQFENGEISESEYKTMVSAQTQYEDYISKPIQQPKETLADRLFNESSKILGEELDKAIAQLTQEDKIYLAMKWGAEYQPQEWIQLEQDYNNMMNSFDIQDADTKTSLILLCKTNLKANQAIDGGDVEGFQKLIKVSETLRKTAKFTAAQNKEEKGDYVDSVGELVAMCERDGFIPRYATDIPQDKVDLTLKDMKEYLHKLVTQDLGFGQQIEDSIKKIQIQKEMNASAEKEARTGQVDELIDEDYEEFYNSVEHQKKLDNEDGNEN